MAPQAAAEAVAVRLVALAGQPHALLDGVEGGDRRTIDSEQQVPLLKAVRGGRQRHGRERPRRPVEQLAANRAGCLDLLVEPVLDAPAAENVLAGGGDRVRVDLESIPMVTRHPATIAPGEKPPAPQKASMTCMPTQGKRGEELCHIMWHTDPCL